MGSKCLRDFNVKKCSSNCWVKMLCMHLKDWHRLLTPCEVLSGSQQPFPLKLCAPPAEAAVSPVGYERGSWYEDLISSAQSQGK